MRTLRRVLFVTHNFPRATGDAAGSFVLRLATALQTAGLSVDVIAPGAAALVPHDTLDGVHVSRVRYGRDDQMTLAYHGMMAETVRSSWSGRLALVRLLLALRRATRDAVAVAQAAGNPYDLIHVHWWFPAALALWGLRGAAWPPIILTMHGSDVRLGTSVRAAHPLMRAVLGAAQVRTTVSTWLAETVRGIAPSLAVEVAPMPVALDRFQLSGDDGTPRRDILFVGRLNAQKGVADLLDALALPILSKARATIVGDGPDGAALRQQASRHGLEGRLTWIPATRHDELPALYQRAAVVCMPSRGEGLGLVAVEAQACGTPVVGYHDGGLLDVVEVGTDRGALVPPGDIPAFAAAVDRILRNGDATDRQALRDAMLERFAPGAVADRYLALYHEALTR